MGRADKDRSAVSSTHGRQHHSAIRPKACHNWPDTKAANMPNTMRSPTCLILVLAQPWDRWLRSSTATTAPPLRLHEQQRELAAFDWYSRP